MKVVIMAGGGGTRLWPLSRSAKPKQFQRLIHNNSLIQEAVLRARKLVPAKDVIISTNLEYVKEIRFQFLDIERGNILVEPAKRDNAAAVGLAAIKILHDSQGEDETMVMLPSDHVIGNVKRFTEVIKLASELTRHYPEYLFTIGLRPTRPETNYGYIEMNDDELHMPGGKHAPVFQVKKFTEKPNAKTAEKFVKRWNYLWNSGMFIWRVHTLLDLYQQLLPDLYKGLMQIKKALGTKQEEQVIKRIYPKLRAISIDYGVIEKAKSVGVIPVDDLDWNDIGGWKALWDVSLKDRDGNVVQGEHVSHGTKNSYIYGGKRLIATTGLKDMVVIDTDDVLFIAPFGHGKEVKEVLEKLKKKGKKQYL